MTILQRIDWQAVRGQYERRIMVSKRLRALHEQGKIKDFGQMAVGLTDPDANYSASEGHRPLGPDILNSNMNAERQIFALAGKFISLAGARQVPELIKTAQIKYLFVGVGSEIS